MSYPNNPTGLISTGMFTDTKKDARKNRERLAAIGLQWFHQCQNERVMQERQWYLNLAFFYGQQNVKFRNVSGTNTFDLYVPKAPYYRVRMVINHVRRVVRKELSRLTAQKPSAYVVPSSNEDADVFAAQAGEQIWDSLWRRLKFSKTLRESVFWQIVCGNGFIKSYWDPTKLDPGAAENQKGDIVIQNISPFHIFVPDLLCTDIEDQPYVIHAQVRTNAWIKQNFGVDVVANKYESVDEQMQNVMGVYRNNNKKDQSVILEIWVKPGYIPELPKGGCFILAADQLVQGWDTWPYPHGQYPFTKLDSIPSGKFYSTSIIEDLIPIQKELNRSRSQLIESKNRMSKPQLAAEEGAVDPKRITTEPGLVVTYKVGMAAPTPIPLQNLPSYVTEEIDRLYSDIQDLSGQHDVSNGSTPPGVTAATAISFLQEQDESLTAPHYTSIEEGIEKVAGQSLNYVKTFWDEPRTIKIVGVDGTFDVQTFRGADLRENEDIRVEAGSALPTSRAAKQAFIMDLMKMGFIPPEKGLEIMEIGALNRLYEQLQVDKRQAQRENLKMRVITEQDMKAHMQEWQLNPNAPKNDPESGLPLDPPLIVDTHTYDNHQIHIEEHNRYRKTQAFENVSPTVRMLFEEHVKQHQEALANTMLHPLTGLDEANPNAPSSDEEEGAIDQMEQEGGSGENPGPEPMPELSGEGGMG